MRGSTWLSIIIPCHRGERWIANSLGSIAAQDAAGIEVVLIDDCATSAACDIAQSYSSKICLRVFKCQDLASWQQKTNFGVQMAGSEHISWLGVDDLWLPGRAAAARRWIEASPATSLHLAPSVIIDAHGKKLGLWRCPLAPESELSPALVTQRLLMQNFVAAPAPVFRRDAWHACGGLDESLWYSADWDMWLKLAALGPVLYHEAATVALRIHGASLTMTGSHDASEFTRQMQIVLERHLAKLGGSQQLERAARASIAVNTALASAAAGHLSAVLPAAAQVMRLGPAGIVRYLRDSRIAERALPRLRAKLSGTL